MSMSEFDRRMQESEDDLFRLPEEQGFPSDFSEEDIAFSKELEALFAIDKEDIPPFFVQTLLEPEDSRYRVVEDGFEHKTSARVFRKLKLRRRLFRSQGFSLRSLMSALSFRQPMVSIVSACLLFMFVTMLVTSNAFASGLVFLLSGAHSGVVQVKNYPSDLTSPSTPVHPTQSKQKGPHRDRISLLKVQRDLHFPMYWPITMPSHYVLSDIYLYQSKQQSWADGPIMELNFDYSLPGVTPHGTGRIAICEFKPVGKVLQVVQFGAAHQMQIDSNGHAQAIYVNGQWVRMDKTSSYGWVYSTRSELIYERDGVIFWIVGDQRDGIDETVLSNIASSLGVFDLTHFMHIANRVSEVDISLDDSTWLFAGEVVYLDNANGSSLKIVGDSADSVDPIPPARGKVTGP